MIDRLFVKIVSSFEISPTYLSAYRVLFCLIVIFIIGVPNYSWIAYNPDYLFAPPVFSLAIFFERIPSHSFFYIISFIIYGSYLILLIGFSWSKYSTMLLVILQIVGQSFAFSFGKIDHNILFIILPLLLVFSGWEKYPGQARAEETSDEQKVHAGNFSIFIVALFLGFAMFTAGVQKVIGGWLTVSESATRGHFLINYYTFNRQALLANFFLNIEYTLLWKLIDILVVILEVGFFFAVFKSNWFRFFVGLAIVFHVCTFLIFNISFTSHFPIYLLFIPWTNISRRFRLKRVTDFILSRRFLIFCVSLAILQWIWIQLLPPIMPLAGNPTWIKSLMIFSGISPILGNDFFIIILGITLLSISLLSNLRTHLKS